MSESFAAATSNEEVPPSAQIDFPCTVGTPTSVQTDQVTTLAGSCTGDISLLSAATSVLSSASSMCGVAALHVSST